MPTSLPVLEDDAKTLIHLVTAINSSIVCGMDRAPGYLLSSDQGLRLYTIVHENGTGGSGGQTRTNIKAPRTFEDIVHSCDTSVRVRARTPCERLTRGRVTAG